MKNTGEEFATTIGRQVEHHVDVTIGREIVCCETSREQTQRTLNRADTWINIGEAIAAVPIDVIVTSEVGLRWNMSGQARNECGP